MNIPTKHPLMVRRLANIHEARELAELNAANGCVPSPMHLRSMLRLIARMKEQGRLAELNLLVPGVLDPKFTGLPE